MIFSVTYSCIKTFGKFLCSHTARPAITHLYLWNGRVPAIISLSSSLFMIRKPRSAGNTGSKSKDSSKPSSKSTQTLATSWLWYSTIFYIVWQVWRSPETWTRRSKDRSNWLVRRQINNHNISMALQASQV